MSIFKKWFGNVSDPAPFSSFFSAPSYSGKAVSLEASLGEAAHWACIWLKAKSVAGLPLHIYREEKNGSRVRVDHQFYEIMASPNADSTWYELLESAVAWMEARGNAFIHIERSGKRVVALTLLPSEKVEVRRDEQTNDLIYIFTDRGKRIEFSAESILHLKGPSFGGDTGLDCLRYGAQVLGSSIAANEAAGRLLGSGLTPSGILTAEADLTEDQKKQLREMLEKFSGSDKAGKTMVLPQGLKYEPVSLDPETMQLIETRKFSVEMVCLFHGVPADILGVNTGSTRWGSGLEQLQLYFLSNGLGSILKRIEARLNKTFITERGNYFEFSREALIAMDSKAKAEFAASAAQNGWMTRAEIRQKFNLPFIDGSDQLTAQVNLSPLDKLGQVQQANQNNNNPQGQ